MSFLFDTDAISEVLKRRPLPAYVRWLGTIPRTDQFTSAVTLGELHRAALPMPMFKSPPPPCTMIWSWSPAIFGISNACPG